MGSRELSTMWSRSHGPLSVALMVLVLQRSVIVLSSTSRKLSPTASVYYTFPFFFVFVWLATLCLSFPDWSYFLVFSGSQHFFSFPRDFPSLAFRDTRFLRGSPSPFLLFSFPRELVNFLFCSLQNGTYRSSQTSEGSFPCYRVSPLV